MDEFSITKHFIEDHKKHQQLIKEFRTAKEQNAQNTIDIFNNLRNAMLHHFQEEDGMFAIYENRSQKLDGLMKLIRCQHRTMERILENAYDEPADFDRVDFQKFFVILDEHTKIEESELYPEFDRVLSKEEREETLVNLNRKHVI